MNEPHRHRQRRVVTFHRIDDETTRVMVQLEMYPQDWVEKAGQMAGVVKARLKDDMKRFKEFIEDRGLETGGWRGEVDRKVG